ncbi:MAG: HDIG domain-containing protein, partial [Anaerolineae bacterium]|nr:HDIG domain-containing protein [Anaerolineae bacterium]
REEAMAILNQAMRGEIKVSQVSSIRRQLPTLVALDTPDAQNDIIVDIVGDLIKPNTFPDETRTATEREAAAAAVEPVNVTIEEDELIIAAGRVVDEATLEKLEALRALQGATSGQLQDFVAPVILMLITTVIIAVSLGQYKPRMLTDVNRLIILTLLLLTFIAFAKLMIPQDSLYQFYPIATLTMLIVFLVNTNLALILAVMISILAGYIAGARAFEVFLYLILGGWAGAFSMGRSQGIADLRRAGTYIALANLAIFTIFGLPVVIESLPNIDLVMAFSWAINAVISVGLAFVGLLVISSLAGITTSIQLQELGRPTQPLQRELLLKAPGTYHHSLMVGNLGEQAAERIGADALLVRVMAYYHDIGKIQRPYFFVENQPQGINVHEKLDPQISAQIIISHVTDGLKMAKKYGLPPVIQDGIAQHQGTDVVRYFYYQAQKAAEEKDEVVDESEFRYPGPKPQTREPGILMLADICETSVRAMKPGSAEEIDEIVEKMIADKVSSGQLNACDLTIADLHKIRTAFVDILQGVHHPRIKYPEQVTAAEEESARPTAEAEQAADSASTTDKRPAPAPASQATGSPSSLQSSNARSKAQPTPLVRRE